MLAIPAWPSPIFFLSEPVLHISFLFLYWQSSPCWTQAFLLIVASSWPSPFSVSSRRLFQAVPPFTSVLLSPTSHFAATSISFGLQNHHHRLPLLPWSSSTPSPPSDALLPSFSFWNRSTSVTVIKIEGSCCAKLWWLYQKLPLPSSLISGHGDGGEAAIIAALLRRSSFRNLQLWGAIHPSVLVLFCRARHVSVNPFWNLVCVDARLLCCAESLSWFSVIGVLIVIVFVSYRNYRN